MPASKLTRVRSEGFSNKSAITRPGNSASRRPWVYLALRSCVFSKMRSISAAFKSSTVRRFRIARRTRLWGAPLRGLLLDHFGQDVAAVVHLLLGEVHGRQQANHGAVRAIDQQSL